MKNNNNLGWSGDQKLRIKESLDLVPKRLEETSDLVSKCPSTSDQLNWCRSVLGPKWHESKMFAVIILTCWCVVFLKNHRNNYIKYKDLDSAGLSLTKYLQGAPKK